MTPDEQWLATMWHLVREHLPAAPTRVVEVGCGPLGGFVPMLRSSGYDALGIDPEAPEDPDYQRIEFEYATTLGRFDALVASLSLHHVADLDEAVERLVGMVADGGKLIVVEWDWEKFDEATAHWCFERLPDEPDGWLHRRHAEWTASGHDWDTYLRQWAEQSGVHSAQRLLQLLDERVQRLHTATGPYFFPDLPGTSETDESHGIDSGNIQATRVDYVGILR